MPGLNLRAGGAHAPEFTIVNYSTALLRISIISGLQKWHRQSSLRLGTPAAD